MFCRLIRKILAFTLTLDRFDLLLLQINLLFLQVNLLFLQINLQFLQLNLSLDHVDLLCLKIHPASLPADSNLGQIGSAIFATEPCRFAKVIVPREVGIPVSRGVTEIAEVKVFSACSAAPREYGFPKRTRSSA